MPLQVAVLKTRAITAVFFVVIMLTGLLWNQWSYWLLFTVIHFGCWYEYKQLILKIDPSYEQMNSIHHNSIQLAGFGLMLSGGMDTFQIGELILPDLGNYILVAFLLLFMMNEVLRNKSNSYRFPVYALCGLLYISLASYCMMMLFGNIRHRVFPAQPDIAMPLLVIATIWVNDTMAYLVGSLIGKTPLSSVSPKKTVEGTLGGFVLAVLVVTFTATYFFDLPRIPVLILSCLTALAGTWGDLLESKLKRMAGVKDSGQIMPGHGGFLDRFDSLLIAAIVVGLVFSLRYSA
ncbi:MAG: phosphatidate cytidylyltransferase [Sediminibacterium sp.]